jgi:hypothetical protein
MIRGLVPKDRLLEWSVEDGWEPLCEFLGKPIPDERFPHVNAAAGWAGQEMRIGKKYILGAIRNVLVFSALVAGARGLFLHFGVGALLLQSGFIQELRQGVGSLRTWLC